MSQEQLPDSKRGRAVAASAGAASPPPSTRSSRLPALAEARRRLVGLCRAARRRRRATSPRRSRPTPRWRSRSCAPPTTATARAAAPAACARRSSRCSADGVADRWRPASRPTTSSTSRARLEPPRALPPPRASPCGSAPSGSARWPASPQRDELAVAALLHDVGRLVLAELYGYEQAFRGPGETPEERARRERRELGIDHALVGAVLVRRWGLPADRSPRRSSATTPPTRPVTPRRSGSPTWSSTTPPATRSPPSRCARPPRRSASTRTASRAPLRVPARRRAAPPARASRARSRPASSTPCAASAEGKVYKQIAQELDALGQHGAHPPAQRLPQDRRGRPRPGRADRARARLDLSTLLDQAAAQADRDRVGAVAGFEAGEDGLGVGADRLGAEAEASAASRSSGRRLELEDLALALGQVRPPFCAVARPPGRRRSRRRPRRRPPVELARRRALGDVGGGAGLDRLARRVALGPRRRGRRSRAAGSPCAAPGSPPSPVSASRAVGRRELDDRDVEARRSVISSSASRPSSASSTS